MSQEVTNRSISQTEKISLPDALRNTGLRAVSRPAAAGAFLGLAWGAALRAWMVLLALGFGEQSHFTWKGTFGGILLPAALVGAWLGGATAAASHQQGKRRRWALLSPLLLVIAPALATENFIQILATTGMGGGAIGVALIGMLGGHAFSGVGRVWLRRISGLLAGGFTLAGGIGLSFSGDKTAAFSPGKAFSGLLFVLLMVLLIAGMSAPFRARSRQTF